jgi:hypothetical protein
MPARSHDGSVAAQPGLITGFFGTKIMAALTTLFNFLALNLALLIASLPIVTLPAAVSAATVALDRWRGKGEDSVIREFISALRARPFLRTTATVGYRWRRSPWASRRSTTSRRQPARSDWPRLRRRRAADHPYRSWLRVPAQRP